MRQGQNSKRSRGRGSGRRNNVPTRHQTVDSNGPSVRIRGSAYQVHEKYLAMARDAATAGDRIAAENYQQHAEHYFRIINADNEGDGRGRVDAQRSNRQQQESRSEGDGETDAAVVVETKAPPPGNGEGSEEVGEGSEQPTVEFPNGEDTAANGSTEAEAPAPKKPRTPRTPRGRSRGPRASGKSGGEQTQPSKPEE
ncbi:MAG: DUF4167 domain-containing protein [Pseudomonadota bacterium]